MKIKLYLVPPYIEPKIEGMFGWIRTENPTIIVTALQTVEIDEEVLQKHVPVVV